jgi:hypothetical protein
MELGRPPHRIRSLVQASPWGGNGRRWSARAGDGVSPEAPCPAALAYGIPIEPVLAPCGGDAIVQARHAGAGLPVAFALLRCKRVVALIVYRAWPALEPKGDDTMEFHKEP